MINKINTNRAAKIDELLTQVSDAYTVRWARVEQLNDLFHAWINFKHL